MSIENNKRDFEKALSEMENNIRFMEGCIDDTILDSIRSVISEYSYYKSDIEDLIYRKSDIEDLTYRMESLEK